MGQFRRTNTEISIKAQWEEKYKKPGHEKGGIRWQEKKQKN